MSSLSPSIVLITYISIKDAAEYGRYSLQYLHRLYRSSKLAGLKLGQVWLIEMESYETYLANAKSSKDHRFGPKLFVIKKQYKGECLWF